MASSYASPRRKFKPDEFSVHEAFWRDNYNLLKERGYTLRDRYDPNWIPSWKKEKSSKHWVDCEDGQVLRYGNIADAVRRDGSLVALKEIKINESVHEIAVGRLFSSEPLSKNPRNHCAPLLEVIDLPAGSQSVIIVMPFLLQSKYPPFRTVGELAEHFRQIFEGLEFMHANNVVHGDCKLDNFMADALSLYTSPPHPSALRMRRDWRGPVTIRNSRTRRPVKHYLIDFGLSRIYRPEDGPPLREPVWGGDQSVPEFALPDGWEDMGIPKQGLEFMKPLIDDMTASVPKKRPSMADVVKRFDEILKGVDDTTLRSPVLNIGQRMKIRKKVAHWTIQWLYKLLRISALPRMMASSRLPPRKPEELNKVEAFWRDHYTFLKQRGYTLRDRYDPNWIPSWKKESSKRWMDCEDSQIPIYGNITDAVRHDGSLVVLKGIEISKSLHEIEVGRLFSSEPLSKNPRNHCAPILEVIDLPAGSQRLIIVMPFLIESKYPPFRTIGELVEHFRQIFESLCMPTMWFMGRSICRPSEDMFLYAYSDCKLNNFMADTLPLYASPPHLTDLEMRRDWRGPVTIRNSRTRRPVKHYLIDFGLSRIYRPEDGPPLREPVWGGDQSVPEFALPDVFLCDPFAVDVYCGWEDMGIPKQGLGFMKPLIDDMTVSDPKKRPSMADVVKRFDEILKGVDDTTLRSPVLNIGQRMKFRKKVAHWTIQWIYKLLPTDSDSGAFAISRV
ncbi:hypothetical protein H0H93_016512 [Arthromyces matolae]|nr:hypothetical protein H0H93_016512 [Arthromyces matolae]